MPQGNYKISPKYYGITIDANKNIWFTENNSAVALIGEYTTTGQLLEYKIRTGSTTNLTPHLITVDPAGNVYLGTGHDGRIYKVAPDGKGALLYDAPELDVTALVVGRRASTLRNAKTSRSSGDGPLSRRIRSANLRAAST